MTKTFEERLRAQAEIRANNNNAITHGQLWDKHKGKTPRQRVPPPPPAPAKTFTVAEWLAVTEVLGRLGTVFGNMEAEALSKEYELVAARLPFLESELESLTRHLIGSNK